MRKLRTIQVVNVRWFNATAWYALFLSRLLRENGHEALVLGLEGTDSFRKAEEWGLAPLALPLNSAGPLALPGLARSLRSLLRGYRPDVVDCHRGEYFFLWGLLKKLERNFALVRTRGDQRPPRDNLLNRLLYAEVADALIATNSGIADIFLDRFAVPSSKVFTVPGGVDTHLFYPDREEGRAARSAFGYRDEDFVVGILGRLDPVKGHEILIRALGRLRRRHPELLGIRLLCIGAPAGMDCRDIELLCLEEGIAERTRITGRVENVRACINALDLGVLASVASEAIARAALEMLACDVPLLSSDIGVMPDILPSELLVPLADIDALAGMLEVLRLDREKLEALRLAGRRALEGLRPRNFLEGTLEAYAAAAAAGGMRFS
ncbi:MAG: glycosyltransferase [Deltaproteobacteria bacterium]|jgi:glycosyltransferase involved in cell wall biosynthesis|nr:glycosyltransferase [Deltaproteobacteria bacterium]